MDGWGRILFGVRLGKTVEGLGGSHALGGEGGMRCWRSKVRDGTKDGGGIGL